MTRKGDKKNAALTLASNNILVDQYLKDYPRLAHLNGKARYWCSTNEMNLQQKGAKKLPLCSKDIDCPGCHKRVSDERKMLAVPWALCNYHTYLAMNRIGVGKFEGMRRRFTTLIVDEAHNLIPLLQELGSVKVWYHKLPDRYKYNLKMQSIYELRKWLETIPNEYAYGEEDGEDRHINLMKFKHAAHSNKYIFKIGEEEYRGELMACIKLLPVDITDEPKLFFGSHLNKIVLMSATISPQDIAQLGLYHKKIKYISASSPIPIERRPVVFGPNALNMSYQFQDKNLPQAAALIKKLALEFPDSKGLIHAPYSLALKLRHLLTGPRYRFHDQDNKREVYEGFRSSMEHIILVASGMYEGVDLPYDAGHFQAIVKMPYPSLADPAIAFKAEQDKKWYAWETIKLVQQACGRICRGPDDFGATFILDNSFERLYNQNQELWPDWFKAGLRIENI